MEATHDMLTRAIAATFALIFDASGRYVGDRTTEDIGTMIFDGLAHPDYARVTAPALAIYAVRDGGEGMVSAAFWSTLGDADREKVRALAAYYAPLIARDRERFRREVVHGQVLEVRGAHHYVFLSHRAVVVEAMRAFLGS
jgi:pimeloyl-ACP methyl ester carboxylesterase